MPKEYLDVNWKIRWAYSSRNYVNNFTSSCAHIILALMVNRFGLMSAMEGSERPFYASSNLPYQMERHCSGSIK